jgi:hypothetical protein
MLSPPALSSPSIPLIFIGLFQFLNKRLINFFRY